MRKYITFLMISLFLTTFVGCEEAWENHYGVQPETVDQSVWDVLKNEQNLSSFVNYMEQFNFDSIFDYNDVYTFFIPTNEAFAEYLKTNEVTKANIGYHILRHFIQPNNITGKRKIQTLMLKFAQFENSGDHYLFDDIPVTFSSPLYRDGRYFTIESVATPHLSLYEYIGVNIPTLKQYIDELDSIILDKELSKPLGFDEEGNTIYDSVISVINLFEEEYFEVSKEFRLKTATLAFPKQDKYNAALTNMALKLGGNYKSHEDISLEWQHDILIPYLLEHGVFENLREPNDFAVDSMKNILGDSIFVFYRPVDRTICSNGYAYDYREFEVRDSLFMSPLRTEGESMVNPIGQNRFSWHDSVKVISSQTFVPGVSRFVGGASNDTSLYLLFPNKYEGTFSVEFNSEPIFPRRYLMVVRTHMDYGGIYDIYVNDELVKTFDYYDYVRFRGVMPSAVSGIRHIAVGRYNKFDFWVDNITDYGKAKIRFDYRGPTNISYSGLFIDYVELVPESMTHVITRNP